MLPSRAIGRTSCVDHSLTALRSILERLPQGSCPSSATTVRAAGPVTLLSARCTTAFQKATLRELCRRGMSCWERWVEVAMTGFVGWVGKIFAVLASDSSLSGALGGVFPANGSSSAHQHERPFHVHRHGDELQMASVAPKPEIADTAHAVPALHRGEGALNR